MLKEAYGEFWEKLEEGVNGYGWCILKDSHPIFNTVPMQRMNKYYARPASLKGIELIKFIY